MYNNFCLDLKRNPAAWMMRRKQNWPKGKRNSAKWSQKFRKWNGSCPSVTMASICPSFWAAIWTYLCWIRMNAIATNRNMNHSNCPSLVWLVRKNLLKLIKIFLKILSLFILAYWLPPFRFILNLNLIVQLF